VKIRGLVSFALALTLAGAHSTAQVRDASLVINEAAMQNRLSKPEAAAALLRRAWWLALNSSDDKGKERRDIQKRVDTMMRKIDPRGKRALTTRNRAANTLAKAALDYSKAGWNTTALELIEVVQKLEPHRLREDLMVLRRKLVTPAPKKVTHLPAILEWFRGGSKPFSKDPWFFSEDAVASPICPLEPPSKARAFMLVSRKRIGEAVRLVVEMRTGGSGQAAFCWNWNHPFDLETIYGVDIRDIADTKTIQLGKVSHGKWTNLSESKTLELDAKQREWVLLEVEIRGREISAKLGSMEEPLKGTADHDLDGKLVLVAPINLRSRSPVHFRKLEVHKL
jgi:hypothetical protein